MDSCFVVVLRQDLPPNWLAVTDRSYKQLFRVVERQGLLPNGLAAFARSY